MHQNRPQIFSCCIAWIISLPFETLAVKLTTKGVRGYGFSAHEVVPKE